MRQRDSEISRISILHAKAGSFAAYVACGAAEGAKAAGFGHIQVNVFDSPIADPGALLREAFVGEPELLIVPPRIQPDR